MKCLVTKLKASVKNDNLPVFDSFKLYSKRNSDIGDGLVSVYLHGMSGATIKGSSTANFRQNDGSIIGQWVNYVEGKRDNGDYIIEIKGKSKMDVLQAPQCGADFSEINYCPLITVNLQNMAYGDISVLTVLGKTVQNFLVNFAPDVTGNISIFEQNKNLETLGFYGTKVEGLFSSLGECTKLRSVQFESSNISGSVEDFVKRQRAAGRATGSVSISGASNTKLTYQGAKLPSGGIKTLSWTADSISLE